jgi:Mg-chelatase subunit ChlD
MTLRAFSLRAVLCLGSLGLMAASACSKDSGASSVGPIATDAMAATEDDSGSEGAAQDTAINVLPKLLPTPDAATTQPPPSKAEASQDAGSPASEMNPAGDKENCGQLELKADTRTELKQGNIVVVFDRSGSMQTDWSGVPKYQAAGNALVAALTPLQDHLTVGGIFFPSPSMTMAPPANLCPTGCDPLNLDHWSPQGAGCCLTLGQGCLVNSIEVPDQINFSPASGFIAGLPQHWTLDDPMGMAGTPLEAGIDRAAEAIKARTFTDPLLVLVITDGEPNCGSGRHHVLDQVAAWKTANIPTHVVGLPGALAAADLLNMMAQAGGSQSYIDPKDPKELEDHLRTVISSTVKTGFSNCTFNLQPKAAAPDKLHLIVTQNGQERDVPRKLSKDAHWSVNAAGDQVTLEDQLCKLAMDGTFQSLRFVFGCVDVPPLDPPPPPAPEPTPTLW